MKFVKIISITKPMVITVNISSKTGDVENIRPTITAVSDANDISSVVENEFRNLSIMDPSFLLSTLFVNTISASIE